jgi:hypothetical protein
MIMLNTRYLVTVDVESVDSPAEWPYEREEYPIGCVVESRPWGVVEALGSSLLIVHRFGGTYGPVRYALNVDHRPPNSLRLTLLTAGGVPFYRRNLDVWLEDIAKKPIRLPLWPHRHRKGAVWTKNSPAQR